ncbi:MAG TPA: hypothetical protein PLX89_26315, partial [Verrucomicrobiota bacterium]|nr:hypothetical protein [Verrucomicrobiota bacterium]
MTFKRRSSRRALCAILWLSLLVGILTPVTAEPMVVFLKNGDRLSGEITSENDRRIVLKSAVAGRITIPRDQIDRVMTAAALAASSAPAAPPPTPAVAVAPPSAPAATATATPRAPTPAPTNAAPVVEPWLPPWFTSVWTNWHGNAQLGA